MHLTLLILLAANGAQAPELVHPSKVPAASVSPPVVAAGGRVFASALVRAGDAWVLAYYRARNSVDSDLYLVRFDDEARVLSDTLVGPGIAAALAWSGDALGLAYSAYENGDYVAYFVRADARGRVLEDSRVRVTDAPTYAPRLAWNGKKQEWAVAWHNHRDPQAVVRVTRIASSGVVLGTFEPGIMGGVAALVSASGNYHFLVPALRWIEHDGERVVASADLATQAYEPTLVVDGETLVASWVEGPKAMVARIATGKLLSKREVLAASGSRHIQGLAVVPRASDMVLFWGEHTSAVYDTAVFAAHVSANGTTKPVAVDAAPGPQGFPFVAATPERLMLVYQLGDYNGSPRLLARRLDRGAKIATAASPHPLLEKALAEEQKKSLTERLQSAPVLGGLPPANPLPCRKKGSCRDVTRGPETPDTGPGDQLVVTGALSPTSVSGVITSARQTLTRCFPSPRAQGRLVLVFTIDARGLVVEVGARDDALRDERVTGCLFGAVARLRFGAASGTTKVKLPIRY